MNVYRVRVIGGQTWEVEANDKTEARGYLSNNYPWQTVIRGSEIVLALNMTLAEYMRQETETENPAIEFTIEKSGKISVTDPTCETCRFYYNTTENSLSGRCRAYPPQWNRAARTSIWPHVETSDWCGQHQPKAKGGA